MISVIIPAYNEEENIERCLESLVQQKTTRKFEVILVNNNSTDSTVELAKRFHTDLDLQIILEPKKGRGVARKTGFEVAQGSLLFSTDSDTVLPPNWIEVFANTLENSNAVAVTGTCKISDCSPFTNFLFNFAQPRSMRVYKLMFGHYWLSGFSFAIKREAYEKSGGFNENLNASEDIDLSFKVAKIGKILLVRNLPVMFSGRRFKRGFIFGAIPYLRTFIEYYVLKKDDVTLSDPR